VRDDRERLLDVVEAIERIERHTTEGRVAFDQSELIQNWIVHHLQIIGEACRALSPKVRDRHPEVPWLRIIGMRHILVHKYFEIDGDLIWSVVVTDLPALKRDIEAIARTLPPQASNP
jgi:uncharacterized protein with HEPN domain